MSLEGGHPAVRKDSPRPQPHSMMKKHEGLAQPEPSGTMLLHQILSSLLIPDSQLLSLGKGGFPLLQLLIQLV